MESIDLRGKPVADSIKNDIINTIADLEKMSIKPKFCLVRLGNNEDDISYESAIRKNTEALGIDLEVKEFSEEMTTEDLLLEIDKINSDENIHAVMLFRPLPSQIDERAVALRIDPNKDIDAMSPVNIGKIFEGITDGFVPCTAQAVIELLEFYGYNFQGVNVVVLGRSLVVGKPLAMLFLNKNSTVTICHSRTRDLKDITKRADVVVSALGIPKFLDNTYFNEKSVVVDVGINVDENGKLCGDVDYEKVNGKVKAITPVPRGVGSITTSILMSQIVRACRKQKNI